MNISGSEINSPAVVNFVNSQSTQGFNGCSVPRLFIPCKNLKLAMDRSSARQLCKSVDSDFEKLNLHHRVLPTNDEAPQMDCIDMTRDIEIKAEPGSVINGVVTMRLKKQRTDLSSSHDDLTKERPMSWEEGELSDSEIMKQGDVNNAINDVIKKDSPGSPMAVGDSSESNFNSHEVASDLSIDHNGISSRNGNCPEKLSSVIKSPRNSPQLHNEHTSPNIPHSPAVIQQHSQSYNEYVPVISPHHGRSGSPVNFKQNNIVSRPHSSQSPSPILPHRPTSSSSSSYSPSPSPQLGHQLAPALSPSQFSLTNSPIHTRYTSSDGSIYSPTQSPLQTRHPFSDQPPVFSPHQSPIQPRHKIDPLYSPSQSPQMSRHPSSIHPYSMNSSYSYQLPQGLPPGAMPAMFTFCYPPSEHSGSESKDTSTGTSPQMSPILQARMHDVKSNASNTSDDAMMGDRPGSSGSRHSLSSVNSHEHPDLSQSVQTSGISRQQLINSPCPICGDKISGFHYGIFSCESCKGFFKRTVQNKKNYVCLRGANCPVTITTRKKCPACRFEKCLRKGMKLEAIREDRTRGGRSTYQCTYSIPSQAGVNDCRTTPTCPPSATPSETSSLGSSISALSDKMQSNGHSNSVSPTNMSVHHQSVPSSSSGSPAEIPVPPLINEILAVEHLWHYNTNEGNKGDQQYSTSPPARMMADLSNAENDTQFFANLCNIADYRLYKIVKWCKSLPLFKEITMDDQISLLINAWCELLVLSCCYRSIGTPNEIRISQGKSVTLQQAQVLGLGTVIERMLNITEHFRRLKFDECEYVCLKVIILLTSDVTMLKEPHKVQHCQEQVLHAMQTYTSSHCPQMPSKFGETLLRIPDLERTCQIGKETLFKHRSGDMPSFNLLMELLRGEH